VRAAICARLATLNIRPVAPYEVGSDGLLSEPGSAIAVLRVEAREDIVIAEAVARLT